MGRPIPHPAKAKIVASGRHQYEVAGLIPINPSTLAAILNRRHDVPAGLAERLGEILNADPAELFDNGGAA